MRKGEKRELPGPASFVVGVVVKLIDDDVVCWGVLAVAKGEVGEDFGGATNDGGFGVDGGVAGDEAYVFGAEGLTEGEEFFVSEGFNGDGVVAGASEAESTVVKGCGDEGFSGTGGGIEDDVFAFEEFEDGIFLMIIGFDAGLEEVGEEVFEGLVGGEWRVGFGESGHEVE